jgi:hypothetical protein
MARVVVKPDGSEGGRHTARRAPQPSAAPNPTAMRGHAGASCGSKRRLNVESALHRRLTPTPANPA